MKNLFKLSTLLLIGVLSVSSFNALASAVVFKAANDNIATKACMVAATDGMDAAKALVQDNDINFDLFKRTVSCNGMSMSDFASTHLVKTASQSVNDSPEVSVIKLVAKTDNTESKLCLDAVVLGETQARKTHNMLNSSVMCNNVDLSRFVRTFKNKDVVLYNSED